MEALQSMGAGCEDTLPSVSSGSPIVRDMHIGGFEIVSLSGQTA